MNAVGGGFKLAAMDMQLGSDLIGIGATILQGAANQAQIGGNIAASWAKQTGLKMQIYNFEEQAKAATKEAGLVQEAGRQSRESRMVQLGNQKGKIVSSAAGSGIDVSSKVVQKVMDDSIKSAYADSATIARNEQQAVQQKVNEATSANLNKIWSEYNLKTEQINEKLMFEQSRLAAKATDISVIGGALSAGANLLTGAAGAAATFNAY